MIGGKDKIIIKQHEAEQLTKSGFYIPENWQKKPRYGTVVSVGVYDVNRYGELKEGDTVSFGEGTYDILDDMVILHPNSIYAKIEGENHKAFGSNIIVKIHAKYTESVKVGNIDLAYDVPITEKGEDVFFDKKSRLIVYGEVLSVPDIQPYTLENKKIKPIIEVGDTVYFRYMNTADIRFHLDKSIDDNSKEQIIRVPYEDVFCVVRDKIYPVGEWILADPFIEGEGEEEYVDGYKAKIKRSEHGIILSMNTEKSKKKAIVRHIGELQDYPTQLKEGDTIYSVLGLGLDVEIDGHTYYCLLESYQADLVYG